jgi:hypothetical protein
MPEQEVTITTFIVKDSAGNKMLEIQNTVRELAAGDFANEVK